MPPKGSKKQVPIPATPEKKAKTEPKTAEPKTPSAATPARTPKTPKAVPFTPVPTNGTTVPVNIEVDTGTFRNTKKGSAFEHLVKMSAPDTFTIQESVVMKDGPYEGCQVIVIRPAKAFAFAQLPEELRNRIYKYYFAAKGLVGADIAIDGKRSSDKKVYAKAYANQSKDRVGIVAVNKEISKEALDVLYSHTIRFESTATLTDFLASVQRSTKLRMTSIAINNYVKSSAGNAMSFLSDASNLKRVHFAKGVLSSDEDPTKAAKAIYPDLAKLVEAIGATKGDKAAGVDALSFGKGALTFKDKNGGVHNWSDEKIEALKENLKAKFK